MVDSGQGLVTNCKNARKYRGGWLERLAEAQEERRKWKMFFNGQML